MAKTKKTRRRHGEGSYSYYPIMKRWRAFFVDPDGHRISKCFIEENDANDWLTLKKAEVIQQEYLSPSTETFGGYSLYYLKTYCKNAVRARTYEGYLSLIAHADPLAEIYLQELTANHFIELYAQVERSGSTKKKLHQLLKQILNQAIVDGKIKKNPILEIPKSSIPKAKKTEIEIFSPEELQKIFAAANNGHYENLFQLFSLTGMRLSEGLGLRWQDFDSFLHRIHIRQTLHRSLEKGIIFEEPKSTSSNRHISIPIPLSIKIAKMERKHPTLIFTNKEGGALKPDVAIKAWKTLLKEAGVSYRGLHTLRHTHATLLLKAGTPITEVSRRLGHARVSTTLDMYSHAIPADDIAIVDKVNGIYTFQKLG